MALIEDHMKDCEILIGKPFKKVHLFLDQYAEIFNVGVFLEYHRSFLHNGAGLAVVEAECGKKARTAAEIHIVRDYMENPVTNDGIKRIKYLIGEALLYFNNPENFKPDLNPAVVRAWAGKSLCQIAFGDRGYDKHYRNIRDY